jgi:hypothetical protein
VREDLGLLAEILRSLTLAQNDNTKRKGRLLKADLVSLRADVLERLKAPIAQSQGESGAALKA